MSEFFVTLPHDLRSALPESDERYALSNIRAIPGDTETHQVAAIGGGTVGVATSFVYLVITCGRAATMIRTPGNLPRSVLIPRSILPTAKKHWTKNSKGVRLEFTDCGDAGGEWFAQYADGAAYTYPEPNGNYPSMVDCGALPDFSTVPTMVITIDAAILWNLVDTMSGSEGDTKATLLISTDEAVKPIGVLCDGRAGVLMPCDAGDDGEALELYWRRVRHFSATEAAAGRHFVRKE